MLVESLLLVNQGWGCSLLTTSDWGNRKVLKIEVSY